MHSQLHTDTSFDDWAVAHMGDEAATGRLAPAGRGPSRPGLILLLCLLALVGVSAAAVGWVAGASSGPSAGTCAGAPAVPTAGEGSGQLAQALADVQRLRAELDRARARLDAVRAQVDAELAVGEGLDKVQEGLPPAKPAPWGASAAQPVPPALQK